MPRTQPIEDVRAGAALGILLLLTCLSGAACGGHAARELDDAGPTSASDGGTRSAEAPEDRAATAGGNAAPTTSSCASPNGVSATLSWQGFGYSGYTTKPGYFGFS